MDIDKEITELTKRFRLLKKAIEEEDKANSMKAKAESIAEVLLKKANERSEALSAAERERIQAEKLSAVLAKSGMLGIVPGGRIQLQPTDEQLFGGMVVSEEELAKQEASWGQSINNWLNEASKPLNSRFSSPEEEQKYWDSIKVNGGDDGGPGY